MFCEKCGAQLADDALFCETCGHKVENADVRLGQFGINKIKEKVHSLSSEQRILGVALICIMVAVGIILIYINGTINLNKYLKVSFEGYDTVGKAVVEFDKEAFEEKYGDKLKYRKENEITQYLPASEIIWIYINGSLDKDNNLSNGEEVTYEWSVNEEEIERIFDCRVKFKDEVLRVEGLSEVGTFDPFKHVQVEFVGAAPYGTMSLINTSTEPIYSELKYIYSDESGLDNGDTVKVKVEYPYGDLVEYCVSNFGVVPSETEKEYVVENLGYYARNIEEISEEVLNEISTKCIDEFKVYTQSWSKSVTLTDISYVGSYLLVPYAGTDENGGNILYMLYEVTTKTALTEYGVEEEFKYIHVASVNDVIVGGTSHNASMASYGMSTNSLYHKVQVGRYSWQYQQFVYKGHGNIEEAYKKLVSGYSNKYMYDSTFGTSTVVPIEDEWKNLYIKYVKNSSFNDDMLFNGDGYSLVDLDGNGVPELIESFMARDITIVSCKNGKLSKVELSGYVLKYDQTTGKIIATGSGNVTYDNFSMCSMIDGKIVSEVYGEEGISNTANVFFEDESMYYDAFDYWRLNDKEVTKAEYEKLYDETMANLETYQDIVVYDVVYANKDEICELIGTY